MKIGHEAREALEAIRTAHPDGRLTPGDVLAQAADEGSPLHPHFTWEDTEAARRFRLLQAAQLIVSVRVTMPTASGSQLRVRAYVSMASDRITGGGYRPLDAVMSDASWREELLRTAMAELRVFQERYRVLAEELAPVFAALSTVQAA